MDLAHKMELYFQSPLFDDLEVSRQRIAERVSREHSWDEVGRITQGVYANLLADAAPARSPQ